MALLPLPFMGVYGFGRRPVRMGQGWMVPGAGEIGAPGVDISGLMGQDNQGLIEGFIEDNPWSRSPQVFPEQDAMLYGQPIQPPGLTAFRPPVEERSFPAGLYENGGGLAQQQMASGGGMINPLALALLSAGAAGLQRSGWQPRKVTLGEGLGAGMQAGLGTYLQAQQMQERSEIAREELAGRREQRQALAEQRALMGEQRREQMARQRHMAGLIEQYRRAPPGPERQAIYEQILLASKPEALLEKEQKTTIHPFTKDTGLDPADPANRVAYSNWLKKQTEFAPGQQVNVYAGMTPENAAKTELLNQGISDMEQLKEILMPGGKVDRRMVWGLNVPGLAGVPGTQSRTAYSLINNAVEAKLRAESGAAVPQSEVDRMADRFKPSPFDSDETIRSKMARLESFLRGAHGRIKGAGQPSAGQKQQGHEKDPWEE